MGIFSKIRRVFSSDTTKQNEEIVYSTLSLSKEEEDALLEAIRTAEQDIPSWITVLVTLYPHLDMHFFAGCRYLIQHLGVTEEDCESFIIAFYSWVQEMEYQQTTDIQSELSYRFHELLGVEEKGQEKHSLFASISKGLSKTRAAFTHKLHLLLSDSSSLNEEFWEELEAIFLSADVGYEATEYIISQIKDRIVHKDELLGILEQILQDLFSCEKRVYLQTKPLIYMVVGVNGAGKTTTVAKLANIYKNQGKKVLIVAGDTFRAAAIEQLEIWSKRLDVGFFAKEHGADAASVAFEGIEKAKAEGYDIVLIDTAGRLHTKTNLMEELSKVYRVIKKCIPEAPHAVMLVLDATIGQNALIQTGLFNDVCPLSEVIFTKLDGTAKGGVAIAVSLQYKLPITYIGLGEKMEDLQVFDPSSFSKALIE